jgi:ubiquinone biosynthesis monooxygenase Coq7
VTKNMDPDMPKLCLPGDQTQKEKLERMIRVNHAGEYGAVRIYQGQLAVLKGTPSEAPIKEMANQETRHLEGFERVMSERAVRPTALSPIWHVAGFALGAGSALLGPKAAMACTEAIEEVIDDHYAKQVAQLPEDEKELRIMIEDYRGDEVAHRDMARKEGSREAPGYEILKSAVKNSSRLAIWLSKRI